LFFLVQVASELRGQLALDLLHQLDRTIPIGLHFRFDAFELGFVRRRRRLEIPYPNTMKLRELAVAAACRRSISLRRGPKLSKSEFIVF